MPDVFQAAIHELTVRRDALTSLIESLQAVTAVGVGHQVPAPEQRAKPERRTSKRETPERRKAPALSSSIVGATNGRDEAVLKLLRRNNGVSTSKQLLAAMPKEAGLTDAQQDKAYRNTMTRLKAKGFVGRTGDTWSLIGAGSEA